MPAGTYRDRRRPGPGLAKWAGTTWPGARAYTTITPARRAGPRRPRPGTGLGGPCAGATVTVTACRADASLSATVTVLAASRIIESQATDCDTVTQGSS